MRATLSITGLLIATLVGAAAWVDEGEVATLVTTDVEGRRMASRLWIVDIDGQAWVRASAPRTRWLERLRQQPEARLGRGSGLLEVRAAEDPSESARDRVNQAMALKYGRVDRVLALLRDPEQSVPVRLDLADATVR